MVKFSNRSSGAKSKRVPLKLKHKVMERVKEHNKKMKKEARKMQALGMIRKKKKTDIDIPNLFPLKGQMLDALLRKKDDKQKQKQAEQLQKPNKQSDIDFEHADNRQDKFQQDNPVKDTQNLDFYKGAIEVREGKKYFKEVQKVLENSDIILEVLDARDPLSCRCKKLEAQIQGMKGDKKIILVLNKIDLVPAGNAEAWLKYLRREYATVLFKANTQEQKSHLQSQTLFKKSLLQREELSQTMLQSNKSVGADKLIELIKNYSKTDGIKGAVTVGVIGYPNVGKSSLINSLKRSKACGTSSQAGFTKVLQEIMIDSKVKILDCPGVIFDDNHKESSSILRNIIKVDEVEDPIEPVQMIMSKIQKNDILMHFKIADFNSATELLVNVAVSRGKLIKGGAPDLKSAGRIILHDWNIGKLKYYTIPPQTEITEEEHTIEEEQ